MSNRLSAPLDFEHPNTASSLWGHKSSMYDLTCSRFWKTRLGSSRISYRYRGRDNEACRSHSPEQRRYIWIDFLYGCASSPNSCKVRVTRSIFSRNELSVSRASLMVSVWNVATKISPCTVRVLFTKCAWSSLSTSMTLLTMVACSSEANGIRTDIVCQSCAVEVLVFGEDIAERE